jgi:alkylation response protein AidB-like acyl-CoA dehydrogenase
MTQLTDRSSVAPASRPAAHAPAAPVIDVAALGEQLMGRWAAERRASRALVTRPEMRRIEGLSMADHRARVLEQLKLLVAEKSVHKAVPASVGGLEDAGGNIAQFEELILADPSLQIKSGVQWGLFGAAVMHLGTAPHHEAWLPGIMSLDIPGAFAMTETGHGSDVSAVGTTATFDEATSEFVIHTPFRAAWKDYLGNAALHGEAAVVFAQLITKGVNHGVHAFYVPLRDAMKDFLPGVGGDPRIDLVPRRDRGHRARPLDGQGGRDDREPQRVGEGASFGERGAEGAAERVARARGIHRHDPGCGDAHVVAAPRVEHRSLGTEGDDDRGNEGREIHPGPGGAEMGGLVLVDDEHIENREQVIRQIADRSGV